MVRERTGALDPPKRVTPRSRSFQVTRLEQAPTPRTVPILWILKLGKLELQSFGLLSVNFSSPVLLKEVQLFHQVLKDRPNYGGGDEDNGTSFRRSHACIAALSGPDPAAGHRQPTPLPETPGHSQAALGLIADHRFFIVVHSHQSIY